MTNTFTFDEINLMCIYDTTDRVGLIIQLQEAMPYIENEELSEITATVISKLVGMTDDEYREIELKPTVTPDDTEDFDNEPF